MPKSQLDRATRDSFAALEVIPSQLPFSGTVTESRGADSRASVVTFRVASYPEQQVSRPLIPL